MPPPARVPHKPPSVVAAASTDHEATRSSQTSASPSRAQSAANAISTPSRDSARPPAVQIVPSRAPIPIPSAAGTRPTPVTISMPSRDAARPPVLNHAPAPPSIESHAPPSSAPTAAAPPVGLTALPVDGGPLGFAPSAISDAQIDPALLEAVVTALRHADETRNDVPPSEALAEPSTVAPEDTAATLRPRRRRQSRSGAEGAGLADEETADASARPSRPRRKKSSAGGDGEASSAGGRRRRAARQSTDGPDDEEAGSPTPRRKRARRSRAPSLPPFDPDADPGEEIDPTAVTMAELCDDTGRGRVSSKAAQIVNNHAAWRAANRERRARQRAIAEAKKYGRNLEEEENRENVATPLEKPAESTSGSASAAAGTGAADDENAEGQKGDDYDYTQALATSRYNVQVRIGPNGETIIDETSLLVDRQEEDDTAEYTHIEESDTSKFVNSGTYSKKLRGSRWSAEETELFFDVCIRFALSDCLLISVSRPSRNLGKTTNSSHTYSLVATGKHARINSRLKTGGTPNGSRIV